MKMIYLILIISTISSSCRKDKCELPDQIIGTGEIDKNALKSQPVITWEMKDKEHVIQVDSLNKYNLEVSLDNGSTYDSIDFSVYTLLVKYARGNCEVTFVRNVTKNNSQKKVYYNIEVLQCGTCEINWESMNWVLIPKIPNDYEVVFNVTEK